MDFDIIAGHEPIAPSAAVLDPLADLFSLIGWLTHYNGWLAVS